MFYKALKMFLSITVLTGVLYPLFITLIAQVTMNHQANGSLIKQGETIIGSSLIGQNFSSDLYFMPRPSAVDYKPIPSGGSTLSPTSKQLQTLVQERLKKTGAHAPADLIYASGSGLDPHITVEAALYQVGRIAKARSMKPEDLKKMIEAHAEGLFDSSYINVLQLNLKLDEKLKGINK